ncbi:MAG: hypothetical protein IBX72_15375 [Nitrospirae bacterium]|nr:hypothetical protein [Nitrospirota bacterium]
MIAKKIIASITESFKEYIQKGLFSRDFIGPDQEYYAGGRCHSRVLGLIIQCLLRLGFYVDVERSIYFHTPKINGKRRMNKFRPDITAVDPADHIIGIIEYETIDATREHLLHKIDYFKRSLPANLSIKFVLFITTLPTLTKRPNTWIEKNRSTLVEPLTNKFIQLSSSFPEVEFVFAYLNEDGIYLNLIINGVIKEKQKNKIFK